MLSVLLALHLALPCDPALSPAQDFDRTEVATRFIRAYNAGSGSAVDQIMVSDGALRASDDRFAITGGAIAQLIDTAELGDYRIRSTIQFGEQVAIAADVDDEQHLLVFEFDGRCIKTVIFFL